MRRRLTTRWTGAAVAWFSSKRVPSNVPLIAPPGQRERSAFCDSDISITHHHAADCRLGIQFFLEQRPKAKTCARGVEKGFRLQCRLCRSPTMENLHARGIDSCVANFPTPT
jgi:hypothetical protein